MNYEQTKQYLYILLDMEKNLYILKTLIDELMTIYNSSEIKKEIKSPTLKKAKVNYINDMIKTGLIIATATFIIFFILKYEIFWETFGVFVIIIIPLIGGIFSVTIGLIGALIIGPIVAQYCKTINQKKYDSQFESELYEYRKLCYEEKERIENENKLKGNIRKEILLLKNKYNSSEQLLTKFYNYNILSKDYHNNIIAISSFYQYFIKKQTYSLETNPKTGDKGAYSIYKKETKQGAISTKISETLSNLGRINSQEILQKTIYDANIKIDYLLKSVTFEQLSDERALIQKYISERTHAEMGYMCVINSWHLSDSRAI